jgi:hypothetical protein
VRMLTGATALTASRDGPVGSAAGRRPLPRHDRARAAQGRPGDAVGRQAGRGWSIAGGPRRTTTDTRAGSGRGAVPGSVRRGRRRAR